MDIKITEAGVNAEKKALRREYRMLRSAVPADERARRDRAVCETLADFLRARKPEKVFFYAPMGFEIDVMPLFSVCAAAGLSCGFPRCETETSTMKFYEVSSEEQFLTGAYGIREPGPDCPVLCPDCSSVILVPGLVYDTDGYRVGFGKGYYDRFLASFPGISVGIVYDEFVLPHVPRGEFDLPVNCLAAEKGVRTIHAIE
ncbi:MAG: 5-formyltetrahydrofolate cyclo-ligase [Clostridia bacterium]|nr:5-formyltetrahydrofolate cyclo-ligase [Clostridia bacterium]